MKYPMLNIYVCSLYFIFRDLGIIKHTHSHDPTFATQNLEIIYCISATGIPSWCFYEFHLGISRS
jgi:hypothetical protein